MIMPFQLTDMSTYDLIPSHFGPDSDIITVNIIAKELQSQDGYPRGEGAIGTGRNRYTWKFLAPEEISENISHQWEEYESVATRLSQQTANIHKAVGTVKQAVDAAGSTGETLMRSMDSGDTSIEAKGNMLRRAAYTAGQQELTDLLQHRVDSTLIYKNSNRREYTLTLQLASYDEKTREDKIYSAIKMLQKQSCPKMEEDMIQIKFPAVFYVYTSPIPIIRINHAALIAVQPTWSTPFKKGFPMRVELQLTFKDIEPLYRRSLEQGGIVRTS